MHNNRVIPAALEALSESLWAEVVAEQRRARANRNAYADKLEKEGFTHAANFWRFRERTDGGRLLLEAQAAVMSHDHARRAAR